MSTGEVPSSPTDAGSRPLCVITLSSGIDRVEVKLWRTLLMTIGGNHPPIVPLQVVEVVATSFNIDASSMAIMAAAPEDFLLVLSDTRAMDWVFNHWMRLHGMSFSLFFKRWTRLNNADAAALPIAVDVEFCRIPAHAW
jgi:hypothetical protein